MQRIFTEDVLDNGGDVKFPAGMVRDFPRTTWENIEQVIGKSLSEFTDIPPEAFHAQARKRTSGLTRRKLIRKETG